jgi:hypothetical protein
MIVWTFENLRQTQYGSSSTISIYSTEDAAQHHRLRHMMMWWDDNAEGDDEPPVDDDALEAAFVAAEPQHCETLGVGRYVVDLEVAEQQSREPSTGESE